MPKVSAHQASKVHGLTQRAQAGSTRPSISAGERDGEADIAQIDERWMEGEARVLQQRIEIVAVDRRRDDPQEWVRCHDDEGEKAERDHGLDREHARLQAGRKIAAEGRDQCAKQGQDQDPQHHRAFVIAPDAGDFID
jgi:hypothetical protein